MNGGFQFFFENDWPGQPSYSIFSGAFREIGSTRAAECLEQAVSDFPSELPHLDREIRRKRMAETSKAVPEGSYSLIDRLGGELIELEEENYRALATYIQSKSEHFPSVAKLR